MDLKEAYEKIWAGKLVGIQPPSKQSIDRVTWTAKMFRPEMKGEDLLDLGTGSGAMLHAAKAAGMHPIGVDFDESVVKWLLGQGYLAHQHDLNKDRLPFQPDHFGVVTSCDVIEHLTDPFHMLTEAWRMLKPGGTLFVATPNCSYWERVQSLAGGMMFRTSGDNYLKDGGHLAYYGPHDFRASIHAAGFEKVKIHFFGQHRIPERIWNALRVVGGDREVLEHTYMIAEAMK